MLPVINRVVNRSSKPAGTPGGTWHLVLVLKLEMYHYFVLIVVQYTRVRIRCNTRYEGMYQV